MSGPSRVIFKRAHVSVELPETIPEGLKPGPSHAVAARLKSWPFKTYMAICVGDATSCQQKELRSRLSPLRSGALLYLAGDQACGEEADERGGECAGRIGDNGSLAAGEGGDADPCNFLRGLAAAGHEVL